MTALGDTIDLDITGVAHGGVFVGRHEGRVVFVPDAIPGERVRVQLTDTSKSSFWRGDALEVLTASPHRQAHIWSQADIDRAPESRPGGADFGHITLAHQRDLKLQVVREALQRFAALDLEVGIHAASPLAGTDLAPETADGSRWRTRVSLHVDADGRVGPFAARSHRVIEVDDLPLATDEIARVAAELRGGEEGRIDLVQPADGRVRILARPETPRAPRGPRGPRGKKGAAAPKTPRPAAPKPEVVTERVGARDFQVDAGGFWQVHRLAAPTLTDAVRRALQTVGPLDPDAWPLDLYGGVGLLAASIAEAGGTRVTTVESDPRATDHAGENLSEWVGARAETGRVDRWLAHTRAQSSVYERERLRNGVVLLDPPRAGAGREVVEHITALQPAGVVYVACDPVALARDLATFRDAGYDTTAITAFDLFPNSHHVEAVAVLTRGTAASR